MTKRELYKIINDTFHQIEKISRTYGVVSQDQHRIDEEVYNYLTKDEVDFCNKKVYNRGKCLLLKAMKRITRSGEWSHTRLQELENPNV